MIDAFEGKSIEEQEKHKFLCIFASLHQKSYSGQVDIVHRSIDE